MPDNPDLSTLASRPPWLVVKIFKWLAIGGVALSIILGLGAAILAYIGNIALSGAEQTNDLIMFNVSEFASALAWEVIALSIYAFFLWLLALVADKIDQLVWLKASEEDRLHIYNQRQKKKQK